MHIAKETQEEILKRAREILLLGETKGLYDEKIEGVYVFIDKEPDFILNFIEGPSDDPTLSKKIIYLGN